VPEKHDFEWAVGEGDGPGMRPEKMNTRRGGGDKSVKPKKKGGLICRGGALQSALSHREDKNKQSY